MARIDAPQQLRRREGLSSGNLASQLGLIGRQAQSDDYLANLELQSIRANPWLTAAAQAAQGYAQGYSGRAGASTSSAGSTGGFGSEAGSWYKNSNLWGR